MISEFFEWIRFLPVHTASREVLRVVREWVEGEDPSDPAVGRLLVQLERKGYVIPEGRDDE